MRPLISALVLCTLLVSCSFLEGLMDQTVAITDPNTGVVTEVPVGDLIANQAEPAGDIVGSLVGVVTGNPLLSGGAAAFAAAMFAGARRKKKAIIQMEKSRA